MFDAKAFSSSLEAGEILPGCKHAITAAGEYLHGEFRAGTRAADLIRLRAQFMDLLLGALWDLHDWAGSDIALVAVGGYGRGELHPHSDIDILVLLGDADHGKEQLLEAFLTRLWDIGLVIGHSVRTISECTAKAREDTWEFVTYDRVPHRQIRYDQYGRPYQSITYLKIPVGKLAIQFENEVVSSIEEVEGDPIPGAIKIVPGPVFLW